VVDKWLAVQSGAACPPRSPTPDADGASGVQLRNPNKVIRAIRRVPRQQVRFHEADGSGYAFIADQSSRSRAINPQVAAAHGARLRPLRRNSMWEAGPARAPRWKRIRDAKGPSPGRLEIASRALA